MEAERIGNGWRVDVAAGEAFGFQTHPTVVLPAAIFFQMEFAVVAFAEARHGGKFLLDALEESQHGLPLMRHVQLRPDPHVDVEILAERCIRIRHETILPMLLVPIQVRQRVYWFSFPGEEPRVTPTRKDL